MYACKQCGTGNPLDSSFCKNCGAALPEDELNVARAELLSMLEEGNELFSRGRTDEAMLIAEAAVLANPSSHLALSLKGMCHERVGQVAEALECYEAAVALKPDSTLDKIKVSALRNRLAQRMSEAPVPDRRGAAIAAIAAVVLVVSAGSLGAIAYSQRKETPKLVDSATPANSLNTGQQAVNNALNATNPQGIGGSNDPAQGGQGQPSNGQVGNGVGTAGQGNNPGQNPLVPNGNGGTPLGTNQPQLPNAPNSGMGLPLADGSRGAIGIPEGDSPLSPIVLKPDPSLIQHNDRNSNGDPPPVPVTGGPANAPPPDTGVIIIQRSNDRPKLGGSEPVTSDSNNGAEALARTARSEYQLGRYSSAAQAYEKLISMGQGGGLPEQRLGQCYEKLGNNRAAATAFNRAVTALQTQIKAGRNVTANQAALDVCLQHLKVLGGS